MESRFTRAGIRASVSYCVARSLCKKRRRQGLSSRPPTFWRIRRTGGLVNQLEWTSSRNPPNNPWVVELQGRKDAEPVRRIGLRVSRSLCLMTRVRRDRFSIRPGWTELSRFVAKSRGCLCCLHKIGNSRTSVSREITVKRKRNSVRCWKFLSTVRNWNCNSCFFLCDVLVDLDWSLKICACVAEGNVLWYII